MRAGRWVGEGKGKGAQGCVICAAAADELREGLRERGRGEGGTHRAAQQQQRGGRVVGVGGSHERRLAHPVLRVEVDACVWSEGHGGEGAEESIKGGSKRWM